MASNYSDSLKLELMETGANANTWGNNTNTNLETIDAFTAGYISKSVAGSANVTLTTNNADPTAEASNKVIEFTGTLTGDITVFVPAVENNYIFFNNTSGSFTLTVAPTGHGSNGVAIVQGAHTIQYCTGDKIVDLFANSFGTLSLKTEIDVGNNIRLYSNGVVDATNFVGNGAGMTGVGEFASGTKAMFVQTAAPTGFTTDTSATLSECCLQVVNGTGGGTGGSDTFSSVFGTKNATGTNVPIDVTSLSVSAASLSAGNHTLSTPEIPSHNHSGICQPSNFGGPDAAGGTTYFNATPPQPQNRATGNTGGGGSHGHPFSGSANLTGSLTSPLSVSVPSMDLKYTDSIVATKD